MNQDLASILGIHTKKHPDSLEMARSIEEGFPPSTIDRLKHELDVTDLFISAMIGRTTKTVGRMRSSKGKRLPVIVSDRLFRLMRIYARAKEVFEDSTPAREWLHSPQIGLNNRTPLDLVMTEAGEREVENLLTRIEHGVIS